MLPVDELCAQLHQFAADRDWEQFHTPKNLAMALAGEAGVVELVEAKAGTDHRYVRQALGQLLDYVMHSPQRPTRLTALFPTRPSATSVELLHRYGIKVRSSEW